MSIKTVVFAKQNIEAGGVILLGGFDGMHIGHRRLLARAKRYGAAIGVTSIMGGKGEALFTSLEREMIFAELGADFLLELPFEEIREMSAKDFLALLVEKFDPIAYICGDDFRFGKGAEGTVKTLEESASVPVFVEKLLRVNGEKVSSSMIKSLLADGKTEEATMLLGREFFLLGKVEEGRRIGRTIDFPTANIRYPAGKFPLKQGVYETRVCVGETEYKGITNFGARPTFDDDCVLTETYLDGYEGDLYGQTLCVRFVRYLRGVRKFGGAEALKKQLEEDLENVRKH